MQTYFFESAKVFKISKTVVLEFTSDVLTCLQFELAQGRLSAVVLQRDR